MGNLFTEEVGKVLTRLLGNVLTEGLGKVLDIYRKKNWKTVYYIKDQKPYQLSQTYSVATVKAPSSWQGRNSFMRIDLLVLSSLSLGEFYFSFSLKLNSVYLCGNSCLLGSCS